MPQSQKNGEFVETSYFDNTGGLNIADSPFKVLDTQATGGVNFQYAVDGAIQKRLGHDKINAVADVQLKSRGLDVYSTTVGVKHVIRAAERKIQEVDLDSSVFTNLSQDTVSAGTDVFPASTSTQTAFAPYNTDTVSLLNFVGNTDGVYSIYSPTKFTKNGAVQPAGSISVASTLSTGGSWTTSGTFWYAVGWHKASTGAVSNATLDLSIAVTTTLQTNNISLSSITPPDLTTYDYGILYRSAVGGSQGFTAGDIVTTFANNATTVADIGSAQLVTQSIPRANSVVLDNSTLPAGTYNAITLWKRRLVTAVGSTVQMSEVNVPESWPTVNAITIPSGGPITALATIAFNTDFGNDEYLAVFKERELWLIKGNDYTDFTLSNIDAVGCPAQSLITLAQGFLAWIDYRGVYLWNGSGKPIYISKFVEPLFAIDGDIDKSQLPYGCSFYYRTASTVGWFLTSKTYGEQKICLKVDLKLTLPGVESSLSGRVIPAVFIEDEAPQSIFACKSLIPEGVSQEMLLIGDNAGFLYDAFSVYADADEGIDFEYYTPFMDMGSPNVSKRYNKVIVWVDDIGDWDLTLDYWSGYRAALLSKSTLSEPISTQASNQTALWDVAFWDESFWDDFTPRLRGIVYNLNNSGGNQEGDCLRLRFRNSDANAPVTIHGYTVIWTELPMRK